MRNVLVRITLLVAIVTLMLLAPFSARASGDMDIPCEFTTEGRVVVVGDLFSEFDEFRRVLRLRELIDEEDNWIGGDAHLVQTGTSFRETLTGVGLITSRRCTRTSRIS